MLVSLVFLNFVRIDWSIGLYLKGFEIKFKIDFLMCFCFNCYEIIDVLF